MAVALTRDVIRRAPKVLLHDHLDGGLRPTTVLELARETNYSGLPTNDPDELREWFIADTPGSDLVRYLEGSANTTAGMQQGSSGAGRLRSQRWTSPGRCRLRRDSFRPGMHLEHGLTLHEVVEAVFAGFSRAMHDAALEEHPIVVRGILSAMRQANLSETIAELAVEFRDRGVCGFDIAGPEDGFPPTHHLRAFHLVQREDFHMTIHAGEAFGLPSIWEAVQFCNAERLGHGVRIADDIIEKDGEYHLGRLANFVRDRRIPFEVCPTSNVHTGAAEFHRHAPDRATAQASLSSDAQYRQSSDERYLDDQ